VRALTLGLILSMAVAGMLAAACGDDDDDGDGTPSIPTVVGVDDGAGGSAPTIDVTLKEFEVLPEPDSAAAGSVTFRATNDGPADEHELVIIKTDLAPDALPTADDGSVPEDEVDIIDEIEPFAVGETQEVTVDLEAGSYVLICNIVETEGGASEAHYQLGMRTAFTVE